MCMKTPDESFQSEKDYERIAEAIRFLIDLPQDSSSTLNQLAEHLRLSESHCHKLFHRWAGITPKQFLQFLRKEFALQQLQKSSSILDATFASGLSSPSRLHDLILHWEAITPGQAKNCGKDIEISYGFLSTEYGEALVAFTARGICHLTFCNNNSKVTVFSELSARFPKAKLQHSPNDIAALQDQLFPPHTRSNPLALHLWGSPFQHKVWEALLHLEAGTLTTYGDIAAHISQPTAARAVGTAIGSNSIAILIPCHRVIQQTGLFSGYRWGIERKIALLTQELAAAL